MKTNRHSRLSYDGFGINSLSCEYAPRLATFTKGFESLSDDERDNLGKLFAAAPELLAALEELERLSVWMGGSNPVHDAIESAKRKARAAIAKATGGAA